MRFKINRNVMVELLKSMYKVVPRESPIKELTCFLLEANEDDGYLYVSATNLEVSVQRKIKVQMESGGSSLIKAQLLYQMVHLLGGDDVEILSKTEGLATIISGNCTYTISTLNAKEFPKFEVPFPGNMANISGMAQMYAKTRATVLSSGVPDTMKGIHFDIHPNGFRVISCNLQNISMVSKMTDCGMGMDFTLPKTTLMYLAAAAGDEELQVGMTNTHVVFMKEGMIFSARKLVHDYVNVDDVLNRLKPVCSMKVEYEDFKPKLEEIYAIAQMGEKTSYIGIKFDGEKLELSTQNNIGKSFNEVDAVKISGEETGMKFFYPATHLKNVFDTVEGTLVVQTDARGYILIRDRYNRFMLTRVSDEAVKKQMEDYTKEKKPKKAKKTKTVKTEEKAA